MASLTLPHPHQSTSALAGTWKLAAGRAITIQPREPGLLRIAHGSVWVTSEGPYPGPLNDQGDRFLGAGEQVPIARGERVVLEPMPAREPAYFSWEPLVPPQAVSIELPELAQPARDVRLALGLGLAAGARLFAALLVTAVRAGPAIIRRWRAPSPPSTRSGGTRSWTSQPSVLRSGAIQPPA